LDTLDQKGLEKRKQELLKELEELEEWDAKLKKVYMN
jgi:hypothetical protein